VWNPKVLTADEIGRITWAIQEVLKRGKPIAEVSSLRTKKKADLIDDLENCIKLMRCKGKVFFWVENAKCPKWKGMYRYRYGFYTYPCILRAFKHMDSAKINPVLRDVFLGLLFGYRPEIIQEFVSKQKRR